MEIQCVTPYIASFVIGFILFVLWPTAILCADILGRVLAWIDDAEKPKRNMLTAKVMGMLGYRDDGGRCLPYVKKGRSDSSGEIAIFLPGVILFLAPITLYLSITLYPVTIGVFTLYLLARLARFARRHKKLFDKHIKDPDAHK